MQIHERQAGNVTILDVDGSLTLGDGEELLSEKVASLLQQGRKKVLLNLADVSHIDTGGLAAMVRAYTAVSRQRGSLKLLGLTKRIRGMLAITRLMSVFETFDNEKDAVDSFADDSL